MRFTDTNKLFGYIDITFFELIDKKINLLVYFEDYLSNQDGEILIIGSISFKQVTQPIIIEIRND